MINQALRNAARQAEKELYWPPPRKKRRRKRSPSFDVKKEAGIFAEFMGRYASLHVYAEESVRQDVTKLLKRAIKATERRCRGSK